ncbi:MAG: T9SS type A sorting domain-containing protein [Ignavibacteriae bacterium]|nr:T9SS type A sorting domain-containing protein [Ignavibacteriota bacterium]
MKKIIVVLVLALLLPALKANAQWQPDVRLTNDSAFSFTSGNNARCVTSSGNVVHVVWVGSRYGSKDKIYYKCSTDAGISWGTDTRLTYTDTNSAASPSVAVSGSIVHVVWNDYYNNADRDLYYKRSTDGGLSWEAEIQLTAYYTLSSSASVAVSGTVVHVVWEDYRNGRLEIYYKHSTNSGVNWEQDVRLTDDFDYAYYPSVAVSGAVVHVVWHAQHQGHDVIYYKRSTDAGVSWGADTRLTNDTSWSEYPSVAVSGLAVHVVWRDERDGNDEIYYKLSTNAGINWGADTRLTNDTALSSGSSVAISGSVVHVVWRDERDGIFTEIYYKRNPTGNSIGIININSEIPASYSLHQNYPNPFNPVTKIQYELPRAGVVRLAVYDVMGREVESLVNERQAAGSYEAVWDGTRFASGVYFYRLTAEGYGETMKMMLIR